MMIFGLVQSRTILDWQIVSRLRFESNQAMQRKSEFSVYLSMFIATGMNTRYEILSRETGFIICAY
jgi:hypothetical protein